MVMTDQGTEFLSDFSRLVEQVGSVHHLIDVEAPWQNGRCERHGGVLKKAMYRAFQETKPENLEEIQLVLDSVVGAKNRYYNRDGFSPYQLVFGSNPRLPQSLLSDDPAGLAGLQDLFPHADEDRAAASFRRAHEVRQAGIEALMGLDAKRRVASASRARVGKGSRFSPGQWVHVWSKILSPGTQYYRGRWVAPGVVILHKKICVC